MDYDIKTLKEEARNVLENNILNFWLDKMQDFEHGGFYGRMSGRDVIDRDAEKGSTQQARILWSFSAAYRVTGKPEYLEAANRAYDFIKNHLMDHDKLGVFWTVNADGSPCDTKKQIYAQAVTVYGLTEYYRITQKPEVKRMAFLLSAYIYGKALDHENFGYIEALTRDGKPIQDMRLSDKDENAGRTMNTHMHVMEAFTLCFGTFSPGSGQMLLRQLLEIFANNIVNKEHGHLDLFFNSAWQGKRNIQSFGHDIQTAWLMLEAVKVIGDSKVGSRMIPIIKRVAEASQRGLLPSGAMMHTVNLDGSCDNTLHWWVQCENILGNLKMYQTFNDSTYLEHALKGWQWVNAHLIDWENGEWHWGANEDNTIIYKEDKASMWKCPYHQTRLCLEILESNL